MTSPTQKYGRRFVAESNWDIPGSVSWSVGEIACRPLVSFTPEVSPISPKVIWCRGFVKLIESPLAAKR